MEDSLVNMQHHCPTAVGINQSLLGIPITHGDIPAKCSVQIEVVSETLMQGLHHLPQYFK